MNTFDISPKGFEGVVVTSYATISDEPVELDGYPMADYAYTLRPELPAGSPVPQNEGLPDEWCIERGPFFDRFGAAQLAVLRDADPDVQAFIKSATVRQWINLRHQLVIDGVALIAARVPAVDETCVDYVLRTPVAPHENFNLRKLVRDYQSAGGF